MVGLAPLPVWTARGRSARSGLFVDGPERGVGERHVPLETVDVERGDGPHHFDPADLFRSDGRLPERHHRDVEEPASRLAALGGHEVVVAARERGLELDILGHRPLPDGPEHHLLVDALRAHHREALLDVGDLLGGDGRALLLSAVHDGWGAAVEPDLVVDDPSRVVGAEDGVLRELHGERALLVERRVQVFPGIQPLFNVRIGVDDGHPGHLPRSGPVCTETIAHMSTRADRWFCSTGPARVQ